MSSPFAIIVTIIGLLLGASSAGAQGTSFTYAGFLKDQGAPANGNYDLQFAVFDAVTGGTQQGATVVSNAFAISNGLFTVTLDPGTGVFSGAARWLNIAVRPAGGDGFTNLVPRQQLTATPYAITAGGVTGAVTAAQITGTIPLAQIPSLDASKITTGSFSTAQIPNLDAAKITTGTLSDTLLSANVARLNGTNVFTGTNRFAGVIVATNISNQLTGSFAGNGAGLTNMPLAGLEGGSVLSWPGNFLPVTIPVIGDPERAVAVADVNGDGKFDLIGGNYPFLAVVTNNGRGSFFGYPALGVLDLADSIAPADVNGDGMVDFIIAGHTHHLLVLTNGGRAGFSQSSMLDVGAFTTMVVAADVNGDGKVDLISSSFGDSTLAVMTNDGTGGFVVASTLAVGAQPNGLAAADVNGDGKVDLISANRNASTLTVLTNTGSGAFVLASSPGVGNGPTAVVAADVNGDGKLDLISANYTNGFGDTLTVLTNKGRGIFVLARTLSVGHAPYSLAAADLNGDGKVDLITANFEDPGTLTVLTNDGRGAFALALSQGVGRWPTTVVAADVNNDGKADLITASDVGFTVLFNVPTLTGTFTGNGAALTSLNASQLASGTIPAAPLSGADGSGLANLNASNLTSGTVTDARLSPNVALLDRGVQTFTGGTNSFSGNVGIGTPTPSSPLDLQNAIKLQTDTSETDNYAGRIFFNEDADNFVSGFSLVYNGKNSSQPTFGTNTMSGLGVNTFNIVNHDGSGTGAVALAIGRASGNVGIGESPNDSYKLEVNGTAHRMDNSASWTTTSDRRLKTDITTVLNGLKLVEQLRPVNFRYDADYRAANPGLPAAMQYGLIAQEYQQVFPGFVSTNRSGYLAIDPSPLTFANTAAIQDLKKLLEEQKTENAALKARLEALEKLLK